MNQTFLTKQKTLSLLMLFVATFFVTLSSSAFNTNDHEGCTDPCAPNYDADATEDDGSCETYDTTCDPCVTVWSAQSCGCVSYSIVAFAGYDYTTCSNSISLNANAPFYGTGTWSGPGTFADTNDPNTTVTVDATDGDYTYTWTVDDGCGNTASDNVTVTYQADLAVASGGEDEVICGLTTNLDAVKPIQCSGTWILPAGVTSPNPGFPSTTVTVSAPGTYTFMWQVECDGCTNTDEVIITFSGGCNDVNACNYDAAALCDDGSCIYETACDTDPCTDGGTYAWDATACSCELETATVSGCTDQTALNYDANANCNEGCEYDTSIPGCLDPCASNYNADADTDDGSCEAYDTTCNSDCAAGDLSEWDAATCSCVTTTVSVAGCTDQTATNYDANANCNEGCVYANPGCTDPCAPNYDSTADTDDDSCDTYDTTCNDDCTAGDLSEWDAATCSCVTTVVTVTGCTDQAATNYDANANCNEGCTYLNPGCTDPCAPNYDSTADTDDDSCDAYDTTCNDDCTVGDLSEWDAATCGCVVTVTTVTGCTDPAASNYDAAANCDGACVYDNATIGDYVWLDTNADGVQDGNENPLSGVVVTLTDAAGNTTTQTTNSAGFYNFTGLAAGTYTVTVGAGPAGTTLTTTGAYTVTVAEGDDFNDADFGFDAEDVLGCTDPCAPNYNSIAIGDDGSCEAYNMVCNDDCTMGNLSEWDASMCSCVVTSVTITGCTDENATNYNPDANCNSGCNYVDPGCTDPCAPNYDSNAGMNDGSCDEYSTTCNTDCTMGDLTAWDSNTCGCVVYSVTVYGCTNPAATNYSSNANCNDGTCEFSNCIIGCSDPAACNYNEQACPENVDIYCVYETACNSDCTMGDISAWNPATCQCEFVSGPTLGCSDQTACNYNPDACTGFNDVYCIYQTACNSDCTLGDITVWNADICGCQVVESSFLGCTDPAANNYNPNANCGDTSVYCTYGCVVGCSDPGACNYNPNACTGNDDIYCLMESNSNCNTDCTLGYIAEWNPDICNCQVILLTVVGCNDPAANNYNPEANCGDPSAYCTYGCVAGCGDPAACNYVPNACTENDDTECISEANSNCNTDCSLGYVAEWNPEICNCQVIYFSVNGCTDPGANNYNPDANCDNGDFCSYGPRQGCTDPCATNFDPNAEQDNGTCNDYSMECNSDCLNGDITTWDASICGCVVVSTSVYGCTDPAAINYDLNATCDNGTCELAGCTDPCAPNYNADAQEDNGTCEDYLTTCNSDCTKGNIEEWSADVCGCIVVMTPVLGCTDINANNYDADANCNDGCEYDDLGCTDPCAPNYDADADLDDGTCEDYDMTCNTDCNVGDIEEWDAENCECVVVTVTVVGCTDENANNYDADATCNDGCTYDNPGCTDPCADNYNPDADTDDGTCNDYDMTCNNDCANGDITEWDADNCECAIVTVTVLGCTDPAASNYNADANCDDTCVYDNATIGDYVWFDTNGDGVQDADEDPISGVEITLTDADGNTTTQTTDDDGFYDFTGLAAGTYTVTVGVGPEGTALTTDGSYTVTVEEGDDFNDADFGFNTADNGGCTDPCAPNYDDTATSDNGSCEDYNMTCNSDCTKGNVEEWNPDVCGCVIAFTTIPGCTDKAACNFDPDATCNEGCDYSCFCDIDASVQVVCSPQGDHYQLVFLFFGSDNGSYLVTDNDSGESFVVTQPFFQSVPFVTAGNEGFSYTISATSDLGCNKTISQSIIDCITTAVELVDFNGYASESGNHLNWTTATEMNADMYIVEKSLNGTDFEEIGTVKAQGNSSVSNSYNFLDANANDRVSYYRLIEMNQTGEKSNASDVVTISRTRNNIDIIAISPIPANDFINISFDAEFSTNYQVDLFDITGKLVRSVYGETEAGQNNINIELTDLAIGTYFLSIFDGEEKQVVRFVKD